MNDVSQSLRDEERQAWQRLIRVIGHEINNSLAPIKSIAHSLERILSRDPMPSDWETDMRGGLQVIGARADALGRFTAAYAQLARLPAPTLSEVKLAPLVARVAGLERRRTITVSGGPAVVLQADPDQLEQLLINLVRNAVDASIETNGGVTVSWDVARRPCPRARGRRGARALEHVEPVRAVLHHEAGGIGHRPRVQPTDRRSARRIADAAEPHAGTGLPRRADASARLSA